MSSAFQRARAAPCLRALTDSVEVVQSLFEPRTSVHKDCPLDRAAMLMVEVLRQLQPGEIVGTGATVGDFDRVNLAGAGLFQPPQAVKAGDQRPLIAAVVLDVDRVMLPVALHLRREPLGMLRVEVADALRRHRDGRDWQRQDRTPFAHATAFIASVSDCPAGTITPSFRPSHTATLCASPRVP